MGDLDLKVKDDPGKYPRLNRCLICEKWTVEKLMRPVEIPSQGNEYVQKLACDDCLNEILNKK